MKLNKKIPAFLAALLLLCATQNLKAQTKVPWEESLINVRFDSLVKSIAYVDKTGEIYAQHEITRVELDSMSISLDDRDLTMHQKMSGTMIFDDGTEVPFTASQDDFIPDPDDHDLIVLTLDLPAPEGRIEVQLGTRFDIKGATYHLLSGPKNPETGPANMYGIVLFVEQ